MTQRPSPGSAASVGGLRGHLAWLRVEWHQPLLAVGAALGLVSSATEKWWLVGLVAASVFATVIGSYRVFKRHSDVLALTTQLNEANANVSKAGERLDELEKDLADLQAVARDLLGALLRQIGDELEIGHDERISIYAHDDKFNSFQMLGRYAKNPTYAKPGRTVYADNVGVIGQAWVREEVVEHDLPEWTGDGRVYAAANLARFGLPESECRQLNMKSRSPIGLRYPPDEVGGRPLGVLVLESMNPNWAHSDKVDAVKRSMSWKTLRNHLHNQRNELPLMSGAKGAGF